MNQPQEIIIQSVLDAWHLQIKRTTGLFQQLSDQQLYHEVAPGRNRGVYLLGHLIAVHDRMLPLLNFGEPLFPRLAEIFLQNPDKAFAELPSIPQLKDHWESVNAALAQHFAALQPHEWLQKHTAVTDEDFAREPNRNRLNVVINRTNHLSYHFGQLVLLRS